MEISLEQLISVVEESGDSPLDRISTAALLQSQIAALGDDLLDHFVSQAREHGLSWAQIGEALGVTRQAAQQRHGTGGVFSADRLLEGIRDSGRFKRFTDRARTAVIAAQDAAKARNHGYIGTEHLLLGLMADDESVATKALAGLGVGSEAVDTKLAELIPPGDEPVEGNVPFTPRAKQALENALGEALSLGHNYIGTEHIVLGLHKVSDGLASRFLVELGVSYERLLGEIVRILTGIAAERGD
jgi:hypothetical protein